MPFRAQQPRAFDDVLVLRLLANDVLADLLVAGLEADGRAVALRLLQQIGRVLAHRVVADVAVPGDADFLGVDLGELLQPLVVVADEEQVVREVHVLQRIARPMYLISSTVRRTDFRRR